LFEIDRRVFMTPKMRIRSWPHHVDLEQHTVIEVFDRHSSKAGLRLPSAIAIADGQSLPAESPIRKEEVTNEVNRTAPIVLLATFAMAIAVPRAQAQSAASFKHENTPATWPLAGGSTDKKVRRGNEAGLGWMTGLEPAASGATVRRSNL
jgi:hypothetical protein